MVIFTDGSAQPVGSGIGIKKQGLQSSPIKLAKLVTPHCSIYASEFEASNQVYADFTFKNVGNARNLFIYYYSESAIQSVLGQNRESYCN